VRSKRKFLKLNMDRNLALKLLVDYKVIIQNQLGVVDAVPGA